MSVSTNLFIFHSKKLYNEFFYGSYLKGLVVRLHNRLCSINIWQKRKQLLKRSVNWVNVEIENLQLNHFVTSSTIWKLKGCSILIYSVTSRASCITSGVKTCCSVRMIENTWMDLEKNIACNHRILFNCFCFPYFMYFQAQKTLKIYKSMSILAYLEWVYAIIWGEYNAIWIIWITWFSQLLLKSFRLAFKWPVYFYILFMDCIAFAIAVQ